MAVFGIQVILVFHFALQNAFFSIDYGLSTMDKPTALGGLN